MEPKSFLSEERLKYIRFKAALPVKFRLINKSDRRAITDWQDSITQNISVTGTHIEIKDDPANLLQKIKDKTTLVELKISLPPLSESYSTSNVEVTGEVIWSKNGKVGLSFYGIPSNSKKLIENYILERLR